MSTTPLFAPATVLLVFASDAQPSGLRLALETVGMEVVETGDEQQAREVIHQAPPTAVLTDLALPGGDGLGVLSAAKAADGTLPVIVATEMQCRP